MNEDQVLQEFNVDVKEETADAEVPEVSCFIHKIAPHFLKLVMENRIIGASSPKARTVRELKKGDEVVFLAPVSVPDQEAGKSVKKLMFVGRAPIVDVFESRENFVEYDLSSCKLRIGDVKWFAEPVGGEVYLKQSGEFEMVENATISDVVKAEYRKIEKIDYLNIATSAMDAGTIPEYLLKSFEKKFACAGRAVNRKYSKNDMIGIFMHSLELYRTIKNDAEQVAIIEFLEFVRKIFELNGIYKETENLKETYSKIATDLKFDHIYSRDHEKNVVVKNRFGGESRFGYIRLKTACEATEA